MRFAPHLVLLIALLPLASADHIIHHRAYIVGRALDASGLPAPGFPVGLAFENVSVGAACFDEPDEVTGPRGDIDLCRHVHGIPADAAVSVTVADTSLRVPLRAVERDAVAYLQLKGHAPARDLQGDRDFNATFVVAGGAYNLYSEPVMTEEELSNLTARAGENATIRLVAGNDTLAQRNATLDERGRYRIDLEVREIPPGARVRVEVAGKQEGVEADATFRRADITVVRDLRSAPAPTGRPGDDVPVPAGLAVGAMVLVALALRRR